MLISDANILIDMEDGGLIPELFRLPYQFCIPDMLFFDELEQRHGHLLEMGLQLGELSPDVIAGVERPAARYTRASRYDCMALALAKHGGYPLLTGDQHLRKAARKEAVQVMGTLWLVEQMVIHRIITARAAREAYAGMKKSGGRLPWAEAEAGLRKIEKKS
ncbi:MAG: PIN domain-containing protein [Gammaproteobacteria bacterium]|nr:PIN domain-containing protein [Gammaproteobacteria bacterium]